jgi:NTP pyrophosphatase (non-canonical NTP hydrolase)
MMDLDDLALELNDLATQKGFWTHEPDINFMLAKLALIHSEVSETLEALRKQKGKEAVEEELADILIRLLDFVGGSKKSGWLSPNTSFEQVVLNKIEINRGRPKKHGNLI